MSDDDLIRRGDAKRALILGDTFTRAQAKLDAIPAVTPGVRVKPDRETFDAMCAMRDSINEHIPMPSLESDLLQGPENSIFCATVAEAVIAEVLRLRSSKFRQLEWRNFDAWTHWAEGACGTYHVEERNGYWQVELRVGGLVHGVTDTNDTTPEDLNTAKAAAQADYEARILAALDLTPQPALTGTTAVLYHAPIRVCPICDIADCAKHRDQPQPAPDATIRDFQTVDAPDVAGLRVAMVTSSLWIDEQEGRSGDFPDEPCVVLSGSLETVRQAGEMLGKKVALAAMGGKP